MNTNMNELNLDEMEQVNGAGNIIAGICKGVVTYNAQAPLTYEKLEVLYKQALEH